METTLYEDEQLLVGATARGRLVGAGESPYADFNLCHYTGDSPEHVAQCRRQFADALGITDAQLIVPRQTHSVNVEVIDSVPFSVAKLEGVDALVTRLRGVVIGVNTADCVPCVFADAESGVIGVAHAGWRGAVAGIVDRTVAAMLREGASLERMRAWIGACICAECFETGEEVARQFPPQFVRRKPEWPRPHVDLAAYVRAQMVAAGISADHITDLGKQHCTRCHPDRYYSARALGVNSGRNFTYAMLRQPFLRF